jgi:polyisoprenoid-binding protein YceI
VSKITFFPALHHARAFAGGILLYHIKTTKSNIMKTLHTNTRNTRIHLVYFLALILTGFSAFIQKADGQTYKVSPGSEIKVSGTSTLHEWSMLASNFSCEGNFIVKGGQLQDVNSLIFTLPVNSLKAKESEMEEKAYKALKEDQYKNIAFKLTQAVVNGQQKTIKATGNLTIAGVTNEITIESSYVLNADETITCKGSKSIKTSDYKMKQVSLMLGTIKTGDAVTIDILLKLKKNLKTT